MRKSFGIGWGLGFGAVAALVLGLWACGGRSVSGINGNNVDGSLRPDGTSGRDGTVRPDGGTVTDGSVRPDASQCEHGDTWSLEEVPIDAIDVLTSEAFGGPVSEGIGIRVRAVISVGGCDEPAGLTGEVGDSGQAFFLRASKWVYQGPRPCPELETQIPLFTLITPWSTGPVTVLDRNGQQQAQFGVRRCRQGADCYCNVWDGIPGEVGDSCEYDCQCSYPMTCVFDGDPTFPPQGRCFETCSTDADCAPGLGLVCQMGVLDAPEGVCERGDRSCHSDADCRAGFSCLPTDQDPSLKACQPTMPRDLTTDRCEDDCDCPAGYRCSDIYRARTCVIPCRGRFDCPETLCCGQWMDHEMYSGPICTECMDFAGSGSGR